MKSLIALVLSLFLYGASQAQSLNLGDVLNSTYSKASDLPVIKKEEINYVIPPFIGFLDTNANDEKKYPFKILYFSNKGTFEKHLKKIRAVTVLNIYYESIYADTMEVTLEISKTNDSQYFGSFKFFTFVDKRRIKLVYNSERKMWEYASLIKLWDEPKVGQD